MTDLSIVDSLGNGEYRITFPKPITFDMKFFLLAGSHNIRVLSPNEKAEVAIGVEGKRETLLAWLKSLDGIEEGAIKSFEESMTD